METKNGYKYTKQWFDFIHETTEIVTPMHTSLYTWIVELNNQLQWKAVFGLPTNSAMESSCIKSYKYYKKTLDDLIRWGFVILIAKAYNQYTCNQIALVVSTKAVAKQVPKQLHHSKTVKTVKTIYNVFYDSEIEKNNDENYKDFVKFLFGKVDLGRPFNKLLKMDDQIDYEKFLKLKAVSEQNGTLIYDKCRALENSTKKYVSLYLTLNNWLKNVR
ncbi:MAG TPA: hypothetical protein VMV77_03430 [Bacteroidales bacterium]|nr:hypothetical protein [Bacteroidales bacterium]